MRRFLVFPWALIALAVLGAVALSSCGGDEVTAAQVVKSDAARVPGDSAAVPGTAMAMDMFAADLYGILAQEEGNLVLSPYSIMVALAMTRVGATGETLEQMSDVLYAVEAGDLDGGLNAIEQALATRSGEYQWVDKKVQLELAPVNQLWGQRDYPFHDAFLDTLAAEYGAGMRLVDYVKATEDARKAINEWVSEQTRERIPELIPEGVLDDQTRLVLTNAIYLNAPWMRRFAEGATAPAPFTLLDRSTVEAQMMRLSEKLRYAEGAGYEAVELPYVDGSLAMIVVVPEEGRFAEFESAFGADVLASVVAELEIAQVNLSFPRFEFRTPSGLKDALSEMGMPIAFDGDLADFSGMSPDGKDLYIQDVLHEAFISVDEEGTEAAAATAVIVGETSAPQLSVDLTVDRPFMFFIRDNETGALLFIGRVLDPTK